MKKVAKKLSAKLSRKKPSKELVAKGETGVRITNDTVAEHREEVLGQARKFRYPLAQSRHKIVWVSIAIASFAILTIFGYSVFLLYKQQSTSKYAYQFTRLFPVPVARVDGTFVSYEEYLFELRHTLHYKITQEGLDFNSEEGQGQLQGVKELTLDKVIDAELVGKLSKRAGIYVTAKEIDQQITLLESQSLLGADRTVLNNVLKKYYDWSYDDFRRSIHDELLRQKYLSYLEKEKGARAQSILAEARSGKDFGELAKRHSEDEGSKANGGALPPLTKDRRDLPFQLIDTAFKLKPGEVSDLIETPYGVEIIKVLENNGSEVKSQHILIKYRNLDDILKERKSQVKVSKYIKP